MTDRRRRAAKADPPHEDNPFAPPPEGEPDRPWQPRRPEGEGHEGPHGEDGGRGDETGGRSRWGSKWSTRQPGRQDGGFGGPGRPDQGGAGNGGGRKPGGLRWDPTDPKQRHARYALHGGIWGMFFALFGLTAVGLLLGALAVYWGVSALRGPSSVRSVTTAHATAEDVAGTDRKNDPEAGESESTPPAPAGVSVTPTQAAKARKTAALSGLVAGCMALLLVGGNFAQQMIYEEYYTCRQDALTGAAREQCDDLPEDEIPPEVMRPEDMERQ